MNEMLAFYVISKEPTVIVTVWDFTGKDRINKKLHERFRNKKAYFIYLLWWNVESRIAGEKIKYLLEKKKYEFPTHSYTFLCNDHRQYRIFQQVEIPCILCNNNALVDERIFKVMPSERKIYDAIYNAQMSAYKRHELASKIENLALVTFFYEKMSTEKYYKKILKKLSHASWLNRPKYFGDRNYVDSLQVAKFLNKAKVGLCLSATEGNMYASMEYMLCGLPIVTTKSRGGREEFFDKEYVKVVRGVARRVRDGVIDFCQRDINPEHIRKRTLDKIKPHRDRFIKHIQEVYDKEGAGRDFHEEWKDVFVDKMVKWQSID